mmetsp:Transcript_20524/g.61782  ORF Transcript_20524/g.61782 Transcript_20524/m.61782 type:complete len:170 (+) Transcript_20524:523-1032(+)
MAPQAFQQLGEAAEAAWQAVQGDIREKMADYNSQPGMLDALKGFAAAVDWTERWIMYLLAFEVFLLTTAVIKRNNQAVTASIFVLIVAIVSNLERLNGFGSRHWKKFAGQNYFDEHGVFMGAMLGAPLLLIMFIILITYLLQLASLLVKMKRSQLRAEARSRANSKKTE